MTEQAPKGRVRCECVGRDPECEQCGGVGHIQRVIIPHGKRPGLEQGIPGALAEEDWQDAREALEAPMRAGHTYHCAARIVWGDGECTCGNSADAGEAGGSFPPSGGAPSPRTLGKGADHESPDLSTGSPKRTSSLAPAAAPAGTGHPITAGNGEVTE